MNNADKPIKEGLVLLCYFFFGKEETPTLFNVINHGYYRNGKISYKNKDGNQLLPIDKIENTHVRIFNPEDIDLNKSMHYWFKDRRNNEHYGKEVILDEDLPEGEIYSELSSRYSFLIKPFDDCVKVKPEWVGLKQLETK